jgi:hypothetical protein
MPKKLTEQEKLLRQISERDWQGHVCKIAASFGWKFYHPPDNRPVNGRIQKVVSGFPDLCLIKGSTMIFAELKRELGVVSPEQHEWAEAIRNCGIHVYIWRPSDLNQVVEILRK